MVKIKENLYPVEIKLKHTLENGFVKRASNERCIEGSVGVVTMSININSCDYPKESVSEAVRDLCEKVLEHFS